MMHVMKRRLFYLLGILLLGVTLTACGGNTVPGDEVAIRDDASRSETTLNVVATNFAFALDAAQVSAGTITFIVTNDGSMPHDFAIQGNGVEQKTAMIKPGQTKSLTVDLQPGTYTYLCTVPGHALLGMRGTLTVN